MPSSDANTASTAPGHPVLAAFLSGIFPGLGQLYNRQWLKGLLFAVVAALTGFGPLSPLNVDIDLDAPAVGLRTLLIASLPFLAIALWSVVDAFRCARGPRRS